MKHELRFYITLIFGYSLLIIGVFTPPVSIIDTSILYASGMFIVLAGATIGIDIPEILREVRSIMELRTKKGK